MKQDLYALNQGCVFPADQKNKMVALIGLWLAETFTTPLKPLNWIQQNFAGGKISTSSTKFVFFGPIGNTRWLPWPLIGGDVFDSPLKPLNRIQQNLAGNKISMSSTKFVVFGGNQKNKMAALAFDWLRLLRLHLWNCWTEFNSIWQEARSQSPKTDAWKSITSDPPVVQRVQDIILSLKIDQKHTDASYSNSIFFLFKHWISFYEYCVSVEQVWY